jgi:hypothetical protein
LGVIPVPARRLDVAGHKPVCVLDQRLEKPPFRGADVGGRLDDNRINRSKYAGRRAKSRTEPGLDLAQVASGAVLVQGVRRIRKRSGREHHDAVRDRPPAGRFDAR